MPTSINNVWTSLEVVKLIVSGLTPIVVVVAGLFLNKRLKRFEHRQWRNQKLIEKRLSIYDDLVPLLNDILCYYTYVGNWKEHTPIQIVNLKRTIDKKIYLAAPIFCKEFFVACIDFIDTCYESYTGWGQDAKLRTKFQRRKEFFGSRWDSEWNQLFGVDNCSEPKKVKEAYLAIMNIFSQEIGLQDNCLDVTGRIPENIR